jgi:NAD-dependent dihydropyrimidine dehydrogenase PreA subunit
MPGTFIDVDVDPAVAADPAIAAKLTEVCPVDIYATGGEGGTLSINEQNLDECVLCGLCIDAAPAGTVRVIKLYDEGAVLQS